MSWASVGRRRCGTACRRSRGYLASHGYDTAGFVANLDYCSRETGLARGFAHYEDFPLSLVRYLHPLHRARAADRSLLVGVCHRLTGGETYRAMV